MRKKYRVIIPQTVQPVPEQFELSAASLLLDFFQKDIEFLPVTSSKTPDIIVGREKWEIKSPIGKGKYTIQHQFQRAAKQSQNVIIDEHMYKKRKPNLCNPTLLRFSMLLAHFRSSTKEVR